MKEAGKGRCVHSPLGMRNSQQRKLRKRERMLTDLGSHDWQLPAKARDRLNRPKNKLSSGKPSGLNSAIHKSEAFTFSPNSMSLFVFGDHWLEEERWIWSCQIKDFNPFQFFASHIIFKCWVNIETTSWVLLWQLLPFITSRSALPALLTGSSPSPCLASASFYSRM